MTDLGQLRTEVEAAYRRLDLPSWPDPHPDRSPRDEEYSRVTHPGRYGIVHARARVWADRLSELPGVRVEPQAPSPPDGDGLVGRFDRGVRVTSPRPGTLPLLLLERDVPVDGAGASLAVLYVSDSGSEDLLRAIDDAIGRVVGGPFVALQGNGWHARWSPDRGGSGGTPWAPDHAWLMELCRRLAAGEDVRVPEETEAFVGRSWLDGP
jgi:hypothetical protein